VIQDNKNLFQGILTLLFTKLIVKPSFSFPQFYFLASKKTSRMKKINFTLLLVTILCTAAQSQKSTFGIKASITSNYLIFYDEVSKDRMELSRTGFNAGLVFNIPLGAHVSLQPQALVGLAGAKSSNATINVWQVELPLHLLYTNNGFFVGAGPGFVYTVDGRAKGDIQPDGEVDINSTEGRYINLYVKQRQLSLNALMGYTFPGGFTLSTNFMHGLNNINNDIDKHRRNIHTRSFGLSMAYMF
jgi:hypothetical protein